eukprot:TRINITY_DN7169_c1_g1_i1.p1 TRINITY_DN7169_c1_g1~~TRINITY_DN7169_c1_g1_i1.p1  ORF type:complete len:415 (+),score=145.55 TRINITY_DN7169_c1_g1_i1:90-1247(+)
MRVLFVSHNLRREGAQLVLATLARLLHNPPRLCAKVLGLGEGDLAAELEQQGVPCAVRPCAAPAEQVAAVQSAAAEHGAEVVVINTAMLHPVAEALPPPPAVPRVVWAVHESDIPTLRRSLVGFGDAIDRGVLERHATVFVCDASEREYRAALAAVRPSAAPRFLKVYNGIDVAACDAVTASVDRAAARAALFPSLGADAFVVVTVGTPKPRKGQLGVVEACCAAALGTPRPFGCAVVGMGGTDSEYEEQLRAAAAAAPEGRCSVALVGRGGQEHVFRHLALSDCYVCNSAIESFPLGILEAMAFSLPVVSTAINGIPEQVADGESGVLYEQGDAAALQAALARLAGDAAAASAMGAAGRRRVERDFTLGAMATAWGSIIAGEPS